MKLKTLLILTFISLATACNQQAPAPESQSAAPTSAKENCVCAEIYAPVCGSDGVTYSNACQAECQGVDFTEGECEATE